MLPKRGLVSPTPGSANLKQHYLCFFIFYFKNWGKGVPGKTPLKPKGIKSLTLSDYNSVVYFQSSGTYGKVHPQGLCILWVRNHILPLLRSVKSLLDLILCYSFAIQLKKKLPLCCPKRSVRVFVIYNNG